MIELHLGRARALQRRCLSRRMLWMPTAPRTPDLHALRPLERAPVKKFSSSAVASGSPLASAIAAFLRQSPARPSAPASRRRARESLTGRSTIHHRAPHRRISWTLAAVP